MYLIESQARRSIKQTSVRGFVVEGHLLAVDVPAVAHVCVPLGVGGEARSTDTPYNLDFFRHDFTLPR